MNFQKYLILYSILLSSLISLSLSFEINDEISEKSVKKGLHSKKAPKHKNSKNPKKFKPHKYSGKHHRGKPGHHNRPGRPNSYHGGIPLSNAFVTEFPPFPTFPQQNNVSNTVLDLAIDEKGQIYPVGVSGPNTGGIVIKDQNGNPIPFNGDLSAYKPNSAESVGIYDMTGNDSPTVNTVKYGDNDEESEEDEEDEGMDEFGHKMKKSNDNYMKNSFQSKPMNWLRI